MSLAIPPRLRRAIRALAGLVALALGGWYALPWAVDLPSALLAPPQPGTRYLASDGTPLRHLLDAQGQRSSALPDFADIPEPLLHATLAAEDKRFFQHGGLDFLAIARAVRQNHEAGRVLSGASTLTQQLVKITALDPAQPLGQPVRRTLATKLREALQARQLEMRWPKQRIAAEYLGRVGYGNLFTGCEVAAQGYFRKPLSHLTPAECAYLAALPQAPGKRNPFRDSTALLPRQQRILAAMHAQGWLSDEAYAVAKAQPIVLQRFTGGFAAPHAVELARRFPGGRFPFSVFRFPSGLEAAEPGNNAKADDSPAQAQPPTSEWPPTENGKRKTENASIRTTIDSSLQAFAEQAIATRLASLRAKHVEHAAAVVIENATGHVLALVGSRDYFASDGGQIDGAWVPHSPGSALKPFTYALAFERGALPASIVADLPVEFQTPTGLYRPENYDLRSFGPMTFRAALGNSLNISAVRVLRDHSGGPEALLGLLQRLGLTTLTEPAEHYGLGLTIGNAPARLVELTNAYATLARLGIAKPWSLLPTQPSEGQRLISETTVYLVADVLADNQARVLTFGPRSPLAMPFRVACKTGTSTSYRDNWALGFTPEYSVGIWAGNFEGQPMEGVSGVTGAAPLLRDLLSWLHARKPLTWYAEPAGLERGRIDPRTGHRLTASSPPARLSREDVWPSQQAPAPATAADYDAQGRALLPAEYAAWLRSPANWLGDLVVLASTSGPGLVKPQPLRVTSPADGLVIHLDPDINQATGKLRLQATPSDGLTWHSDTLKITTNPSATWALLVPGIHRLTAKRGDELVTVSVRVVE